MMSNRSRDDFDRLMTSWMEAEGDVREPAELLDRVLVSSRGAHRRPRWLVPEWWISMQNTARLQAAWRPAPLLFLLATLVVALALVAVLIAGSQRKLPAPFGPAANGVLMWDTSATISSSNADGTGIRTIVTSVPHAAAPSLSSDGLRVAFWGDGAPDSLFVANVDGSGVRKLAGDLWIATDKSAAWSPDGRWLAISTESGPNRRDEHLVVFDVVTGATTVIPPEAVGGSRATRPTWSPDGAWIGIEAIVAPDDPVGYWIVHPDGSGARQLPTSLPSRDAIGLQWRPSAAPLQVAYTASPDGSASLAMVLDVASGAERRVSTSATEAASGPAWSSDATRLAWFVRSTGQIVVADVADPSRTTSLPAGALRSPIAWSPDGRFLYGLNNSRTRLIVIPLDGSNSVEIPHAASQGMPDWQRIAP
jgi:Tol biopolymer transport system component